MSEKIIEVKDCGTCPHKILRRQNGALQTICNALHRVIHDGLGDISSLKGIHPDCPLEDAPDSIEKDAEIEKLKQQLAYVTTCPTCNETHYACDCTIKRMVDMTAVITEVRNALENGDPDTLGDLYVRLGRLVTDHIPDAAKKVDGEKQ